MDIVSDDNNHLLSYWQVTKYPTEPRPQWIQNTCISWIKQTTSSDMFDHITISELALYNKEVLKFLHYRCTTNGINMVNLSSQSGSRPVVPLVGEKKSDRICADTGEAVT